MESFALGHGESWVTFRDLQRDNDGCAFVIAIKEPDLCASTRVDHCEPVPKLEGFFQNLAKNWRGWARELTWRSSEAQLELGATCDATGHVKLQFRLRPDSGGDAWRVTTHVFLEAGQLDSVANRVTAFFSQ